MVLKKTGLFLFVSLIVFSSCAKRIPVTYDQVEQTNYVEITLVSGKIIEGTIINSEPHQLTVLPKGQRQQVVSKSTIRSIKRKPPVVDDFGNGISEEEIESVKTNKNALIYGIGGGALSLGAGFFVGSLIAQDSTKSGSILMGTTLFAGGLGTYLFIRAGQSKDRQDAIEIIREQRRSMELERIEDEKETADEVEKLLDEEKQRQEDLRREREAILRELEQ